MLLAGKKTDNDIIKAIVKFVAEVESFKEVEPMQALAIVNYD